MTDALLAALLGDVDALTVDHKSRAHSVLGASSAKRWMSCPGSVALTQDLPDDESEHAALGTSAHELANICLESGQDALEYVGRWIGRVVGQGDDDRPGHHVDDEMSEAVQVYLDECRRYMGDGWTFWIERRFSLEKFNPPIPMFGTGDFVAYHAATALIVVVDYKHGVGINVQIEDNPQLRYYALGAITTMGDEFRYERVRMTIVQPRVRVGDKVKTDEISADDLTAWTEELFAAARATQALDAPLCAGAWCRESFCKARGRCPEEVNVALRAAQLEFQDIVDIEPDLVISQEAFLAAMDAGQVPAMPSPALLSGQDLGAILRFLPILDAFVGNVREAAMNFIQHGGDIPGWKVVDTRPTAKWLLDDHEIVAFLTRDAAIPADKAVKAKPLSPAQARTAMIASLRAFGFSATDADTAARALLHDKIESRSSGTKLVPSSDDRLAAAIRGSEFFDELPATP